MILRFFLFLLFIAIAPPVCADLESGISAYYQGDYVSALRELTPLARMGNARAAAFIGFIYSQSQSTAPNQQLKGRRINKDLSRAAKGNLIFAGQSNRESQYRLGYLYRVGKGVPQDFKKSVRWYQKAAFQGHAPAQSDLGYMYGTGRGVPRDYVKAYAWYNLAAAAGNDIARTNRDAVAQNMSYDQISRAQILSRILSLRYRAQQ